MKHVFLSAIMAFAPIAAVAESYDCTTTNFGIHGWVPPRIILAFDRKEEVGSALDAVIQSVHKAPIPVKFKKWSDNRFQFDWTLKGVQSDNAGSSTLSYKVNLRPQSKSFTLSARNHGYDNVITGSGSCKRID
jgi:hypothetical protein